MGHHFRDKPWTEDELPLSVRKNMEQIFDRLQELNRPAKELANALEKAGVFKEIQAVADIAKQHTKIMQEWKESFARPDFATNAKTILNQKLKCVPPAVQKEIDIDALHDILFERMQTSMGIIKIGGDVIAELFITQNTIFRNPKEHLFFELTENRMTILQAMRYDLQKTQALADNLKKSKSAIRQAVFEINDSVMRSLKLDESLIIGNQTYGGYRLNDRYRITILNQL